MLSLGPVKGFRVAFKIKTTNIEVHNVVIDSFSFVAHEYSCDIQSKVCCFKLLSFLALF